MQGEQHRQSGVGRITYLAPNRTFDRLFKEESLQEAKEAVRRKLGLASEVAIHLEQLRDGQTVDLEDDDDFDALRDFAKTARSVIVQITIPSQSSPRSSSPQVPPLIRKRKRVQSSEGPANIPRSMSVANVVEPTSDNESVKSPVPTSPKKKKKRSSLKPPHSLSSIALAFGSDDATNPAYGVSRAQSDQMIPGPTAEGKRRMSSSELANEPSTIPIVRVSGKRDGEKARKPVTERSKKKGQQTSIGKADITRESQVSPAAGNASALNSTGDTAPDAVIPITQSDSGPTVKQKKRRSQVGHTESSQSILTQNVLEPANDSTNDPEGASNDIRKRKVSFAQGKPVDASKQKKQKKDSANVAGSEVPNDSSPSQLPASIPDTLASEPSGVESGSSSSKVPTVQPGSPPAVTILGKPSVDLPKTTIKKSRTAGSKDSAPVKKSKTIRKTIEEADEISSGASAPRIDSEPLTDAGRAGDPVTTIPSSKPVPFAEQLASALTKSSDIARNQLSNDRKSKSSKKTSDKQVDSSSGPAISSPAVSDVAPKKRRTSKPDASDANVTQLKKSGRAKASDKVLDDEVATVDVHDAINPAAVKAVVLRVLASKAAETADPGIASHGENADSVLTGSKPENKSKKTKLPTGKSKSKDQGGSQQPDAPPQRVPTGTSKDPTMAKRRKSNQIPCPVCLQSPFHLRYQCPTILAGPDTIRKRLDVLKRDSLAHQLSLVDELETMIKNPGDETKGQNLNVNATFTVLSPVSVREELQSLSNTSEPIPDTSPAALISPVVAVNPDPRPVTSTTVVSGTSDSNNEDTEDDTSEEPNEAGRNTAIEPPIKNAKQITITPFVPNADIDLDTLIRGPATFRRSVADILSDAEKDGDEDHEEVVLEEEDDSAFRRRAKKLSEKLSDSSVEDSEEERLASPPPSARDDDPEDEISASPPLRVVDQDSHEKNESGEIPEGDLANDALATDAEAFTTPKDNGGNDAEVTPISVEDRDMPDEPLSPSLQPNIKPSKSARSSTLHSQPEISLKKNPRVYGKAVSRSSLTDDNRQQSLPDIEPSRTNIATSPSPPRKPTLGGAGELEEDPIEAVVDPLDLLVDSTPSITPPVAPTEGVVNNRGESQRDKKPTEYEGLSPPGDVEESATTVPRPVGEERVNESTGSTRIVAPEKPEERPRTRSAARASLTPLGPPKRSGRLLRLAQEKAREASENVAVREGHAGLKAGQSLENATAMKSNSRAGTIQKSALPASPEASTDAVPSTTSLPSLSEWTTLEVSSPSVDQESQQIDQLRSSSPIQEGKLSDHAKKKKALNTKTRRHSAAEASSNSHIESTKADPLFILSESQVPFPYSQKWTNDVPNDRLAGQEPGLHQTTTSESENEVEKMANKRKPTRTPTYRSLIDIASQKLFSGPAVMPASTVSQSPVNGKKKGGIYGIMNGDEEEEEEEESESGTEVEKSHIPKHRRAGVEVVLRTSSRSR